MKDILEAVRTSENANQLVRFILRGASRTLGAFTDRPEFYAGELESVALSFFEALAAKNEIRKRSYPDITSYNVESARDSDTVFILGAGVSVNELDDSDWDHVSRHDAIGVNNWIVHDFVPDFYFYETPKNRDFIQLFVETIQEKQEEYKNVPLFIQYPHMRRAGIDLSGRLIQSCGKIYYNAPFRYRTCSKVLLRRLLFARKMIEPMLPLTLGSLIHHAGSISYLIMFAMIAGYKKIVLIGVDMVDREYFYEHEEGNRHYEKIRRVQKGKLYSSKGSDEHPTVDREITSSYGEIPLDEYILLFNEIFLRNKRVQLYVNSTRSKLHPSLPRYSFC